MWSAKNSSVEEAVGEFQADKEHIRTAFLAVGTENHNLNAKLIGQQTEVETMRIILPAKAKFVELLKGRVT